MVNTIFPFRLITLMTKKVLLQKLLLLLTIWVVYEDCSIDSFKDEQASGSSTDYFVVVDQFADIIQ